MTQHANKALGALLLMTVAAYGQSQPSTMSENSTDTTNQPDKEAKS